jgi:hypothetical protein
LRSIARRWLLVRLSFRSPCLWRISTILQLGGADSHSARSCSLLVLDVKKDPALPVFFE